MLFPANWFVRNKRRGPHVRPWALAAPIVVLLIALPLLRPLRHPDPRLTSDGELATYATVQAVVEQRTLAIEATNFASTRARVQRGEHAYANQPPTMAVLLAGSYWVMSRLGVTFDGNPHLVAYLLTMLGTTLPVAAAAGLVYRMGRLFELRRPWRTALALIVVLGSGFISYATVLNTHAPAAALVLGSAACLIHVTLTNQRLHSSVWLFLAGLCAALGAAIDPLAAPFVALFTLVILGLRWRPSQRLGGILIYAVGIAGPLLLHAGLVHHSTRDFWGAGTGFGLAADAALVGGSSTAGGASADGTTFGPLLLESEYDENELAPRSLWRTVALGADRVLTALFGRHGLLSHFPVVLLGVLGVSMVMHRHWPATTKLLASVTLAGALSIVLLCAARVSNWNEAMFAARWFVVFLPLTVFWAGAWLRRRHRPTSWALAGLLLAFSTGVSLVGATGPVPRDGFTRYTAAAAARNLVNPPRLDAAPTLAGAAAGEGAPVTP